VGISESELGWFLEHPCPPDVIGLNHYLSGERYLDENVQRYPPDTHGGNGKHRYADVLAARVLRNRTSGPDTLLEECWERYKLPIAVTECHNGCTREEQLRWFLEVWRAAQRARLQGAEVIAVTAWSLLGSFDWSSLVTQKNDHYETGVYDVRSNPPRPTALAALTRALAAGEKVSMPLLDVPGWWRRPRRFVYGISVDESGRSHSAPRESINFDYPQVRPVLIAGSDSILGQAFVRVCAVRGIPYRALPRQVADPLSIPRAFQELKPWAVINSHRYTRVQDSHPGPHRGFRKDAEIAWQLARECATRGIRLLTFSSDLVFDGGKGSSYVESDRIAPLNAYGISNAEAERLVQRELADALIVRSGPLFGALHARDFVLRVLRCFKSEQLFSAANDVIVSPTYIEHLVNASLDLLIDGVRGVWHLANQAEVSWADLARMAAQLARVSAARFNACRVKELGLCTTLPRYSALTSERGILLPSLEDALRHCIQDWETVWQTSHLDSESLLV
jgi:dTDP-4-dehydrorhamnose reductase